MAGLLVTWDRTAKNSSINAVTPETGGACLAIVDEQEIWRRDANGAWSKVAATGVLLQSIISVKGSVFAGLMNEAAILRIDAGGKTERLESFDKVKGRGEWFAGGPPLGVRALTTALNGAAILAAVHVGGIPRSADGGKTWTPTIPIMFDVHEVCGHPDLPNVVTAAAAIGLLMSHDGGKNWDVIDQGLELKYSLAVAALPDEALFSIQDGPFAKRSQLWRCRIGGKRLEQVRDGLPEWLDGKIDTAHITAGGGRAAVVDGGGNLWLSSAGSTGWKQLAADLPYTFGLLIL